MRDTTKYSHERIRAPDDPNDEHERRDSWCRVDKDCPTTEWIRGKAGKAKPVLGELRAKTVRKKDVFVDLDRRYRCHKKLRACVRAPLEVLWVFDSGMSMVQTLSVPPTFQVITNEVFLPKSNPCRPAFGPTQDRCMFCGTFPCPFEVRNRIVIGFYKTI